MSERKFPPGFKWGAATASYQVEGGIENNDWAEAARDGKVPPCGRACGHYERYKEDFDIAKSLGHNCHRLSIEWARIEPEEGRFDEREIEHYRTVLRALHARGIEPFITLWHFTLPLWFSRTGGFERKDAPQIFARYCAYTAGKLSGLCTHFSTMNEPMVFVSNGWGRGTWPPFCKWPGIEYLAITSSGRTINPRSQLGFGNIVRYLSVMRHLGAAHNRAYDAIKKIAPQTEVGIVKQVILYHANANPFNQLFAWVMNWFWTYQFMNRVIARCDVIGLNYYLHKKFGDRKVYDKTDMDWDVFPEGICEALMMLKGYGKPVYVSEAGVADARDRIRAGYIRATVRCMHSAIENGVDVRGFMYWSLLDNYEWASGFGPRFGLVEIDYATQARRVRESAYVYKQICEKNALIDPAVNVGDSLFSTITRNS